MIINLLQILNKKLKSLILKTAKFDQNVHENQMNLYLTLLLK